MAAYIDRYPFHLQGVKITTGIEIGGYIAEETEQLYYDNGTAGVVVAGRETSLRIGIATTKIPLKLLITLPFLYEKGDPFHQPVMTGSAEIPSPKSPTSSLFP